MRRWLVLPFRWLAGILLAGIIISVAWVLVLAVFDPPVTWTMVEQAASGAGAQRTWRDMDEIAGAMPLAVVAAEDQRFMDHHGFDRQAIEKALKVNERRKGRRIRGASTISQQTAKNVFLWQGRTWVRKGFEVWFTLLIETFWSKQRIMEVYLNVAEMGPGRFGVEAASMHCFQRPAARLSSSQAALVAATLPAPRRYSCRTPSTYVRGRQQWILGQMANLGDPFDRTTRSPRPAGRNKARRVPVGQGL